MLLSEEDDSVDGGEAAGGEANEDRRCGRLCTAFSGHLSIWIGPVRAWGERRDRPAHREGRDQHGAVPVVRQQRRGRGRRPDDRRRDAAVLEGDPGPQRGAEASPSAYVASPIAPTSDPGRSYQLSVSGLGELHRHQKGYAATRRKRTICPCEALRFRAKPTRRRYTRPVRRDEARSLKCPKRADGLYQ
jgi:hypothetical protein